MLRIDPMSRERRQPSLSTPQIMKTAVALALSMQKIPEYAFLSQQNNVEGLEEVHSKLRISFGSSRQS